MIGVIGVFFCTSSSATKYSENLLVYLMNIVFTFLYVVYCNCHHPLGLLKGEEFLDKFLQSDSASYKKPSWSITRSVEYKLWTSSLSNFLLPSVTFFLSLK